MSRTKGLFGNSPAIVLAAILVFSFPQREAAATDAKVETRLYSLGHCPTTAPNVYAQGPLGAIAPLAATVLSAIVSPLIETVVDKGVEALKEAAKDKDFPLASPVPVIKDFYEIGISGETLLNSNLGCIVLVRGVFEEGNYPSTNVDRGSSLADRIAAKFRVQTGTQPGDPGVRVKPDTLEFYFEVVPVMSENGKVFGLRPQALHVAKFASSNGLFGPSRRNYKFIITFADPFGSEAFASAEFRYEGLHAPFSEEACVEKSAAEYCPAVELGGIRGWFATKPLSDDLQPIIKKRQTSALTLTTAITPWVAPKPRVLSADDIPSVRAKQDAYCAALSAANKPKAEAHQQWDENCPGGLMHAKREYLYQQTIASARLEKDSADAFWSEQCVDTNKQPLAKNDANAIACLKILAGEKQRKAGEKLSIAAGKFLLTSTIIETRPGNEVAKFLAPAAEKVSPTIKTALKEKFDPLERKKAIETAEQKSATEAKAKRDALRAATVADSEVQIAQIEYDAAMTALSAKPQDTSLQIDSIKKHMALLKAQSEANDAYRAAALSPIPYPGVN